MRMPLNSPIHTELKNWNVIEDTCFDSSKPLGLGNKGLSYDLINPSKPHLLTMSDLPLMISTPITHCSSRWLEDLQTHSQGDLVDQEEGVEIMKSVADLMPGKNILGAHSYTSASGAKENIKELSVPKGMRERDERFRDWKMSARNP